MTKRSPNYVGIVAGAVAFFVFGAIWYTLLSGPWIAAVGKTKAELSASGPWPYLVSFIACLLVAYCFDNMLWHYERADAGKGAQVGLLTGVCIATAMLATTYSYELRPVSLVLIDAGYCVIGFMIAGAIVGIIRGRAAARSRGAA